MARQLGDVNGPQANRILRKNRAYFVQFTLRIHWGINGWQSNPYAQYAWIPVAAVGARGLKGWV